MHRLIVIGASVGGLKALSTILEALPATFPASVAIVQHRRATDGSLLCELLGRTSLLPVLEPLHGAPLRPGHVYLAPPDYHLLVEPGAFALSVDPPVCCSRPSIDVLFESAAGAYGRRTIGVVLTGANTDGAAGAAEIARAGGQVIVQDPATAEGPTCPRAALERVPAARVLPLQEIGPRLVALCAARWRRDERTPRRAL